MRYTRALDLRDWDTAFLKLWSTLELLTDSSLVSNEVTVKRAAYIYEDVQYARQVLEYLRHYRNRSVHAEASNPAIEPYLYRLKRFVEAPLEFHSQDRADFTSLQEACRFLDLPREQTALETRTRLIDSALRFHHYT